MFLPALFPEETFRLYLAVACLHSRQREVCSSHCSPRNAAVTSADLTLLRCRGPFDPSVPCTVLSYAGHWKRFLII